MVAAAIALKRQKSGNVSCTINDWVYIDSWWMHTAGLLCQIFNFPIFLSHLAHCQWFSSNGYVFICFFTSWEIFSGLEIFKLNKRFLKLASYSYSYSCNESIPIFIFRILYGYQVLGWVFILKQYIESYIHGKRCWIWTLKKWENHGHRMEV